MMGAPDDQPDTPALPVIAQTDGAPGDPDNLDVTTVLSPSKFLLYAAGTPENAANHAYSSQELKLDPTTQSFPGQQTSIYRMFPGSKSQQLGPDTAIISLNQNLAAIAATQAAKGPIDVRLNYRLVAAVWMDKPALFGLGADGKGMSLQNDDGTNPLVLAAVADGGVSSGLNEGTFCGTPLGPNGASGNVAAGWSSNTVPGCATRADVLAQGPSPAQAIEKDFLASGTDSPFSILGGEDRLSSTSMESFTQAPDSFPNCFSCHNTQPITTNGTPSYRDSTAEVLLPRPALINVKSHVLGVHLAGVRRSGERTRVDLPRLRDRERPGGEAVKRGERAGGSMRVRATRVRRIASAGLCAAAALLCASTGEGADKSDKGKRLAQPNQCEATWRDAQERSDAGRLRQARDLFLECARPSCGSVFVKQCVTKLTQLEADIPTIVPLATDEAGSPVVNVQVKADGEVVALKLDGRALAMDPGLHELSFSTWEHGVFATEKVMIVEGQRNRPIAVSFRKPDAARAGAIAAAPGAVSSSAPDKSAPEKGASDANASVRPASDVAPAAPLATSHEASGGVLPARRGRSAFPFLLGGVGLASVGAGALMTYWGNKDNTALKSCSPNCASSDVAHIHELYLASDITFAAGAAALGLAGVLLLTGHSSSDGGPARTTTGLAVQPTPSGAFASWTGTF